MTGLHQKTLGDWCEVAMNQGKSYTHRCQMSTDRQLESLRLTSITYFARWSEEGLDYGKDKATAW